MKKHKNTQIGPVVKNTAVVGRIAKDYLTGNPGKSLLLILAIVLCTFLFTVLFTILGNIVIKTQESGDRQVGGMAAVSFKYLNEEEYEKIAADPKLKEVSRWIYVGEATNPPLVKLRTEVHWSDAVSADKSFLSPVVGRYPGDDAEDEICISSLVLEEILGKDIPEASLGQLLGDAVTLELQIGEKQISRAFTICGIYVGDRVAMSQVVLVSRAFQTLYAPTPDISYYSDACMKTADDSIGRINADVDLYHPFRPEDQARAVLARNGLYEDTEIGINWAHVFGAPDPVATMMFFFLLFTVFLSGYLIISNVFRINAYMDIRTYGLLNTIGMSKRQLKEMIRREALLLSAPGILIGILAGFGVSALIFPLVMTMTSFSENVSGGITMNLWILLFSAAFSYITVRISIRKALKIAASVSPMEAVQFVEGTATRRPVRHGRTFSFTPESYAWRNLCREKKQVAFVVLSLALSLVVLNSVYSLITGFDGNRFVQNFIITDFSVSDATLDNAGLRIDARNTSGVTESFLDALSNQQGVECSGNIYLAPSVFQAFCERDYERFKARILHNHDVGEWLDDILNGQAYPGSGQTLRDLYEEMRGESADIYGMDPLVLEKLTFVRGNFDPEKWASGNYILVSIFSASSPEEPICFFEPGETVMLSNKHGETREYEVMGVVDIPYSLRYQVYTLLDLYYIMPSNVFLQFLGEHTPMRTVFDADEESEAVLETWLSSYTTTEEKALAYTSREVLKAEFRETTIMFATVGGILTVILALIGLLNLTNTLAASILSRRMELAMMEAVGMTKSTQKRSLCLEGAICATLAGITGIVLSSVFSVFVVRPIGGEMWYYAWKFTLLPVIVVFPLMLICAIIIPVIIYKKASAKSVVERMRLISA